MGKKREIKKAKYNNEDEFAKLIKLVIVVTMIFLIFYGITFLVNRKTDEEEKNSTVEIQYDNILIGNILIQPNDEYYVMIYDKDDNYLSAYQTFINMYSSKEDAIRVYTADLKNPLNSNFMSDSENFDIDEIGELKIKTTTLIKVKNGKIEKYYVGDNLKNYLKEISVNEEE